MRTGSEVCQAKGIDTSKPVDAAALDDVGLPMVVACTGCGMTMAILSPTVRVDNNDYVWCTDCAGGE